MIFDESRPLWLQLADEFSRRIASGRWEAGAKVGSVRELAAEFGVNPNTVQRALAQLDEAGLTTTERTVGRFVSADPAGIDRHRVNQAEMLADLLVENLQGLGLRRDQGIALLSARWKGQ